MYTYNICLAKCSQMDCFDLMPHALGRGELGSFSSSVAFSPSLWVRAVLCSSPLKPHMGKENSFCILCFVCILFVLCFVLFFCVLVWLFCRQSWGTSRCRSRVAASWLVRLFTNRPWGQRSCTGATLKPDHWSHKSHSYGFIMQSEANALSQTALVWNLCEEASCKLNFVNIVIFLCV